MEIILSLLVGVLMGAFNFGFFLLGTKYGKVEKDGLTVSENNKDFIEEMMKWRSYNG